MCRLYGFRANERTKVDCTLVHAQNALLIQSRSDRRGVEHADGWGIACYENGAPVVERRARAAFADLAFGETAERVHARTVLAHVRRATVGSVSSANTHPFAHGCWTFAHNGTITAFEHIREPMERETAPSLQRMRRGSCDSEQAFYWLLSRMARAGIDISAPCANLDLLSAVFARAVRRLSAWCDEVGVERRATLNFLLTDGTVLLASRCRSTLYWVRREGIRDCEICGIPHIEHEDRLSYRAVVVASEPISHETWDEVPDGHVLVVDGNVDACLKAF